MSTHITTLRSRPRTLASGFIGNVLEWYDFTVYGYFASVIGALFFPASDKIAGLLAAFGVFAAGYLMRPLGGVLFGWLGDRKGRVLALRISIIGMALMTGAIGFLPTHASVGWGAALGLVLLRLLQGISVGGEFTTAGTFLVENAAEGRKGLAGSWVTFGVIAGILLGSATSSLLMSNLDHTELLAYGWRLPFLIGGGIGCLGYFLRRGNQAEGGEFAELQTSQRILPNPLKALAQQKRSVLGLFGFTWAFAVSIYFLFLTMPSFAHTYLNQPLGAASTANTYALIGLLVLIPVAGWLSDCIGSRRVVALSFLLLLCVAVPLYSLLLRGEWAYLLLAQLGFALPVAMMQGAAPSMMASAFPVQVRLSGLSIAYNVGLALFGGTTPLLTIGLVHWSGGNRWLPLFYLMGATVFSLLALLWVRRTPVNRMARSA
jgi:MHS family proline/betaine transporter-like MFS transporter